ncbi:flagellar protein FlaG [Ponticaulis profundi]|uniref:Flagellar protein FlaG n=1 Tax=Ponticaulis profundi TaxID=2665222 RepID=A0ABW1S4U9_9PROT
MAGDLDLSRIAAPLSVEGVRELSNPNTQTQPKWSDADFESPDVSGQRRKALETALAVENISTKGKLVIEQDEETGRFIQKIIDPNNGEVLEQWPEEEFLEMAKLMGEAYGLLIDRNV